MENTPPRPWDAADYLETEEDMVAYFEAAFDEAIRGSSPRRWATSRGPRV